MKFNNLNLPARAAVLFLIPFVIVLFSIKLKSATGPYWLGVNSDPSYIYLMNSLYLVDGIPPIFADHPGATLQILGAIVIKALNWNIAGSQIADRVFENPEHYLNAIHSVLVGIYILSLIAVGYYALRKTKDILFALLTQTPALFYLTLKSYGGDYVLPIIANINAGTVLLTIGNLYVICLLKLYFDTQKRDYWISTIFLGGVCALGIATKFPFFPLFLAPLILLPHYNHKGVFFIIMISSWFIITFPMASRWGYFFNLMTRSLTHAGHLGVGEKGLIDFTQILKSFRWLGGEYPLLFLVAGICVVLIVFRLIIRFKLFQDHSNPSRKTMIFLSVVVLAIGAQFFIVAKQPSPHYAIPGVSLFGILAGLLYWAVPYSQKTKNIGVLVFLFSFLGFRTIFAMQYESKLTEKNQAIYDFSKTIHEKYQGCIIAGYYRSSSPEIAMDFGDDCGGYKAYGPALQAKYPNAVFYNRWSRVFHRFSDHTYIQTLMERNKCVLLYGPAMEFPGYIQVKQIEAGRKENLYKVVANTAEEAVKHYLTAKSFEAKDNYKAAYVHAARAKFLGYPRIDEYIEELKQLAEGD